MINNILLVDDDQVSNFVSEHKISKFDSEINISVTENGQEAKQYLLDNAESNCQVIFLDINMPVMNGFEFLDWFENEYSNPNKPKVVLLSSSLTESDVEKSKTYSSVIKYVEKPIDVDSLKAIESILDQP